MQIQKTKNMVLCAMFVALIAVGAFIRIPIPVVPFTLQILFINLAGLLLGGKLGAIAAGSYMIIGLIGLPVFAEGGGLSYIQTELWIYYRFYSLCICYWNYCK